MNLLHTPSHTLGGYLVAAVPPLMYAVFLHHLLANLRALLITAEKRCTLWRRITLWAHFPSLMWSAKRSTLRRLVHNNFLALEQSEDVDAMICFRIQANEGNANSDGEVAQRQMPEDEVLDEVNVVRRRGRRLGDKRVAFEAALTAQLRSGDLRLFSSDERERNAAAYQAAASLPAPLSPGAARRYVVQALPRLEAISSHSASTGATDRAHS
jgi:hypothetical protein